MLQSSCFLSLFIAARTLAVPTLPPPTVHLAVGPKCGTFSGLPSDVNGGLGALDSFNTIVAFGDSYTDGGVDDGSPLEPAVLIPPNPRAGGRVSDGPVWVEYLAEKAGAKLKDYAVDGALVDATQYLNAGEPDVNDFVRQVDLHITQGVYEPSTTLYAVFFGIGDFEHSIASNQTDLSVIAGSIIYEMLVLSSSPVFARNFLVIDNYGRGTHTPAGEAFKEELFQGLGALRSRFGFNVAFADLANIWDGVLGSSPGYEAFGYDTPGACTVNDSTTIGACEAPERAFYWISGTPSTTTHRIMADYIEQVLEQCK